MFSTSAVGSFTSESGFLDFLKQSGIFGVILLVIVLLVRAKMIEVVSVETNTIAVRQSWGKPKYHHRYLAKVISWGVLNFDIFTQFLALTANRYTWFSRFLERAGRLVVLKPGPHKVLRGWQNLILVNLRELVLEFSGEEMTFRERTLSYRPGATLLVDYEDSREGDKKLILAIFSVRDTNVKDMDIGVLRDKFRLLFFQSFSDVKGQTEPDEQGFPRFNLEMIQENIGAQLVDLHGYRLLKLFFPPMSWTPAQIEADARIAAAQIEANARIEAAQIEAEGRRSSAEILAKALREASTPHIRAVASSELADTA